MERNKLMAFPNCRFGDFRPFGTLRLSAAVREGEQKDGARCITLTEILPENHFPSFLQSHRAWMEGGGCASEEGGGVAAEVPGH